MRTRSFLRQGQNAPYYSSTQFWCAYSLCGQIVDRLPRDRCSYRYGISQMHRLAGDVHLRSAQKSTDPRRRIGSRFQDHQNHAKISSKPAVHCNATGHGLVSDCGRMSYLARSMNVVMANDVISVADLQSGSLQSLYAKAFPHRGKNPGSFFEIVPPCPTLGQVKSSAGEMFTRGLCKTADG